MWHSVAGQAVADLLQDNSTFICGTLLGMLNPVQNIVCEFHYALLSLLIDDSADDIILFTVRYIFVIFYFGSCFLVVLISLVSFC